MSVKNILQLLQNLPRQAVYALENVQDRRVLIGYAHDMRSAVIRILGEIERGCHYIDLVDINKIEIKVLETNDDMFLALYHFNKYKSSGWDLYRNIKPVNPTLKTKTSYNGREIREIVYIKTGRNKQIILGIFNSKIKAEQFIEMIPVVDGTIIPVYANNEYTKIYYKKKIMVKALVKELQI